MTDNRASNAAAVGVADSDQRAAARHDRAADKSQARSFTIDAARLMRDLHCLDVVIFDVQGLSDVTDHIIIASGTSDRQIRSVGQDVEELAEQMGLPKFGHDVDSPTTWLVLDFVDVVVHLFEPATRTHYDLEMMWDDAPRVAWQRG